MHTVVVFLLLFYSQRNVRYNTCDRVPSITNESLYGTFIRSQLLLKFEIFVEDNAIISSNVISIVIRMRLLIKVKHNARHCVSRETIYLYFLIFFFFFVFLNLSFCVYRHATFRVIDVYSVPLCGVYMCVRVSRGCVMTRRVVNEHECAHMHHRDALDFFLSFPRLSDLLIYLYSTRYLIVSFFPHPFAIVKSSSCYVLLLPQQ